MTQEKQCTHADTVTDTGPASQVCEPCVAAGDDYPDARYCTVCGYVGCRDGAKGHHMISHHRETGHPIIKPVGQDEDWLWCYVDEVYVTA